MQKFIFINPFMVRHGDTAKLNDVQKKQLINIFNKEKEANPLEAVENELSEFPCEFWQVVEEGKPDVPIYDVLVLYEDGRGFFANTTNLADIYISQDTVQVQNNPDLEEALQEAYDKKPRMKY